jgi:hypothetical protein
MAPQQLGLLDSVARVERPWKRVRPTSVAQYAHLRDTGTLAARRAVVLRAVAAIRNATQQWPTACEVHRWLEDRGEIPRDGNPNHSKPRLTELADTGVIVRGPKRKSRVSGITVLTWQVKGR